jgi:hypothetical protein
MELSAFYYPWYETSRHWLEGIAKEPLLGRYSSVDIDTINTHIEYLKQAGIVCLIISWWGISSFEDKALGILLPELDKAGIKYYLLYEQIPLNDKHRLTEDRKYSLL